MDLYKNSKLKECYLEKISEQAKDWANTHGVVMKSRFDEKYNNFAPFTLFPSPFPEYLYREAVDIEQHFHTLMQRAADDHEFLETCLKRYVLAKIRLG